MPEAGWSKTGSAARGGKVHKETSGDVASEFRASRALVRVGRAGLLILAASCSVILQPAGAFVPAASLAGRRAMNEAAATVAVTLSSSFVSTPASRLSQHAHMHRRSSGADRDVISRLRGTMTMTRSDSPTRTEGSEGPVWGKLLPAAVKPRR